MGTFLQGFLDNDSFFGRFMTKVGIIIAANILFIISTLPMITTGAGFVALYHVMFKTLRNGGICNPFKEFWKGFKSNFKQATITWIIFVVIAIFLIMDYSICLQVGGFIAVFRYGAIAIGAVVTVIFIYMLPTIACFSDTLPHLVRNAIFFAAKKPLKLIVIAFFDIFPLLLTYSDAQYLPLYSFIWVSCGFGLLAMLGATLLLPEFRPFLEEKDESVDYSTDPNSDEYTDMDDLKKLDGF